MTDDRCQWQKKGGRSFAEREMSANEVKRESCSEGRGYCTELTEANRNMLPRMGGLQGWLLYCYGAQQFLRKPCVCNTVLFMIKYAHDEVYP